ncbi:hypothetical protein M3J09_001330 [Ascochyta lentis]
MVRAEGSTHVQAPSGVPEFVFDYAPLFYLHPAERYRPSSISEFLVHTRPQIEFKDVSNPSPAPTLAHLDNLNDLGEKGGENIYLTSFDDVTQNPPWLGGVPTTSNGSESEETGAIIIVEKEKGVVDVFYFLFFAFNWGGIVLNHQLGNHVGDWEHVMIRFIDSKPRYAWLSQHATGEAYAFQALPKPASGNRPLLYIANGTHAIYPQQGATDHTLPNHNSSVPLLLVDHCAEGDVYDPLTSSYLYQYTPHSPSLSSTTPAHSPATFHPLHPTTLSPGWLAFKGRWGDQQYPATDQRQKGGLLGFRRFGDGPTGPAFKELGRAEVWPASVARGQRVRMRVRGRGVRGWGERLRGWFGGEK